MRLLKGSLGLAMLFALAAVSGCSPSKLFRNFSPETETYRPIGGAAYEGLLRSARYGAINKPQSAEELRGKEKFLLFSQIQNKSIDEAKNELEKMGMSCSQQACVYSSSRHIITDFHHYKNDDTLRTFTTVIWFSSDQISSETDFQLVMVVSNLFNENTTFPVEAITTEVD